MSAAFPNPASAEGFPNYEFSYQISDSMKEPPALPEPDTRSIHEWASLRTELIWVYDGTIHPMNRHRRTDHRVGYWVWLMRQGWAEISLGRRVLHAGEGQCLVSPRGLLEQRFSDDARILSIHFACNWPSGREMFAETEGAVFDVAKFPRFQRQAARLASMVRHRLPPASDIHFGELRVGYSVYLSIGRAFSDWLEVFAATLLAQGFSYSPVESVDARLLQAVQCLRAVPLSQPFPGRLVEQESGLGRSQLDRLFVQSFGMTTRSFWAERRLQAARALLSASADSIKEVSFRLGFKQASHFSKWFQLQAGYSPLDYRRRESMRSVS